MCDKECQYNYDIWFIYGEDGVIKTEKRATFYEVIEAGLFIDMHKCDLDTETMLVVPVLKKPK